MLAMGASPPGVLTRITVHAPWLLTASVHGTHNLMLTSTLPASLLLWAGREGGL
jgi:hypothetical protein